MKALLTILMVAFISATISADPGSKGDYILTKDGKIIIAKLQLGLFKIHAKSDKSCIGEVKYNDVETFQKNGEIYSRKPLYNGREKSGEVFMRLVNWRNGLGLYCYEDLSLGTKDNKRYFMFKDGNIFWLEVDSKNAENIRNFYTRM